MRHLDVSWRKAPVVLLVVGCRLFDVEYLKFENWGEKMLVVWVCVWELPATVLAKASSHDSQRQSNSSHT